MTPEETGHLLAAISLVDNRKPGTPEEAQRVMKIWARSLYDLELNESLMAVAEHFAKSEAYLKPVHIRTIVRRHRAARIAANEAVLEFPGDPDDVAGYLAWQRDTKRRLGNGEQIPTPAITGTTRDVRALVAALKTADTPAPHGAREESA